MISPVHEGRGKNVIPPKERLLLVLWYFATSESHRQLVVRFGTTDSTVHESVDIVMNALSTRLHHLVKFPSSVIEIRAVA